MSSRQKSYSKGEALGCSRCVRSDGERAGKQMEKVRTRTARTGPRWSSLPTASWDNYQESRSTSWCVGVVKATTARISFAWGARLFLWRLGVDLRSEKLHLSEGFLEGATENTESSKSQRSLHGFVFIIATGADASALRWWRRPSFFVFFRSIHDFDVCFQWILFCIRLNILQLKVQSASL